VKCPAMPAAISCTRLGKPVINRPRKILVKLQSTNEAESVIRYAKALRISSDPFVSANVYINADISKEEAKLEFDKRVLRRATRQSGPGLRNPHVTRPSNDHQLNLIPSNPNPAQTTSAHHADLNVHAPSYSHTS